MWTSGGIVELAFVMFKQHGVKRVTVSCLARIIDLDYCSRMVWSDGASPMTIGGCPTAECVRGTTPSARCWACGDGAWCI